MSSMTKQVSTLWYKAPEIILDKLDYTNAIDIWAVGVIFEEMLTGQVRYRGKNELEQLQEIFKAKGKPTPQNFTDYDKYPMLRKFGCFFHNFKASPDSMIITDPIKETYSFGIDNFINALTELDPLKRPTAK